MNAITSATCYGLQRPRRGQRHGRLNTSSKEIADGPALPRGDEVGAGQRGTRATNKLRVVAGGALDPCRRFRRAWPARRRTGRRPPRQRLQQPRPTRRISTALSGAASAASSAAPAGELVGIEDERHRVRRLRRRQRAGRREWHRVLDRLEQIADGSVFPGSNEVLARERRTDAAEQLRDQVTRRRSYPCKPFRRAWPVRPRRRRREPCDFAGCWARTEDNDAAASAVPQTIENTGERLMSAL